MHTLDPWEFSDLTPGCDPWLLQPSTKHQHQIINKSLTNQQITNKSPTNHQSINKAQTWPQVVTLDSYSHPEYGAPAGKALAGLSFAVRLIFVISFTRTEIFGKISSLEGLGTPLTKKIRYSCFWGHPQEKQRKLIKVEIKNKKVESSRVLLIIILFQVGATKKNK